MHARLDTESISTQPMAMGVTADSILSPGLRQSQRGELSKGMLAAMLRQLDIDRREF